MAAGLATSRAQTAAPPGAALSLRDVAVARDGRRIVEGVTFDLPAGGVIILKGPNGSGKTTLLRAIAGLSPIETGVIDLRIDGEAQGSARRAFIVFCGHADAVKAQLSVRENIAFWRQLYGATPSQIDEALTAFDLAALSATRAANLSAGQRRRLSLSRLIISEKPVWLLDEPTASVDATHSARIEAAVSRHLASGGSAIIATHDKFAVPNARSFILGAKAA